jgi:hypothetical protein
MGMCDETETVDSSLSFANQATNFCFSFPRKLAVSVFCLLQTNGSCRFLLVPYLYIYIFKWHYMYMLLFQTEGGQFS